MNEVPLQVTLFPEDNMEQRNLTSGYFRRYPPALHVSSSLDDTTDSPDGVAHEPLPACLKEENACTTFSPNRGSARQTFIVKSFRSRSSFISSPVWTP